MIASGAHTAIGTLLASTALVVAAARWVLPPHLAARVLSLTLVVLLLLTAPVVVLLAVAYLVHVPVLGEAFQWCSMRVGIHGTITGWVGLPAVATVAVGSVRVMRVLSVHRRHRCRERNPVQVVETDDPFAVTLPGRGGQVVVSRGMLEALDADETRVVLAHEHAHAHLRHDRYLVLAALASALVPPLEALARPLRFAVERWADEVAASRCGDRRLVATTLGRVALIGHTVPSTAGIAGACVSGRVAALLGPPRRRPGRPVLVAVWVLVALAGATSAHLVQHLGPLFGALCRH